MYNIFNLSEEDIRENLVKYDRMIREIEKLTLDLVQTPLFLIDTRTCKQILIAKAQEINLCILRKIDKIVSNNIVKIDNFHRDIFTTLGKVPKNEEDLVHIKKIINGVDIDVNTFKKEVVKIKNFIQILEDFQYPISKEILKNFFYLYQWPYKI